MAAPVMSLDVLPASFGDCLLLTCHTPSRPWRLLVDTGPDETYAALQRHLRSLAPNAKGKRVVDTFVVSHIDHDHIGGAALLATYNGVDEALGIIVRVCQLVSWNLLAEGGFGSVVAAPQFDVLEHLDQPWSLPETLPALHERWHEIARSMDDWASTSEASLLPKKPT